MFCSYVIPRVRCGFVRSLVYECGLVTMRSGRAEGWGGGGVKCYYTGEREGGGGGGQTEWVQGRSKGMDLGRHEKRCDCVRRFATNWKNVPPIHSGAHGRRVIGRNQQSATDNCCPGCRYHHTWQPAKPSPFVLRCGSSVRLGSFVICRSHTCTGLHDRTWQV